MSMPVLEGVFGRMLDTDSHEWIVADLWEGEFGPATAPIAMITRMLPQEGNPMSYMAMKIERDDAPIDPDTIGAVKGPMAPGAIDMQRRLEVLDAMGVE